MLTIAGALQLDIFEQAEIVAGRNALHQPIRWVHIIDAPEYAPWVDEGVLLLTTAYGLKDNPATQLDLIRTLAQKGVVGLVIALTEYFHHVPRAMASMADELNFPIVTLPYQVRFIDITKALFERILSEQYVLLKQANAIHSTLTNLVLEGKGFPDLAEALARLLQRPVILEDTTHLVLGHASLSFPVDAAREASIAQGQTPPDVIQALRQVGVWPAIQAGHGPVRVQPLQAVGLDMERVVAPIVVGGEVFGYVWIIAGDRSLDDLDMVAVEHAASVAALIRLKDAEVQAVEQRSRGDFMDQILAGQGYHSDDLPTTAARLGLNAQQAHQILVVQFTTTATLASADLIALIDRALSREAGPAVAAQRGDVFAVVCEGKDTEEAGALALRLAERLALLSLSARIGVGRVCLGLDELAASYRQARQALRLGPIFFPDQVVFEFDALGLLYWLSQLPPEAELLNRYAAKVRRLAEVDSADGSELLHTLEAYLDAGAQIKDAARRLYIHRNTLFNRLERIQAHSALDLDDPLVRLNLHVAIKHARLQRGH